MSGTLVFAAATQRIPLDCLALVAREACVPGSHETVTIVETVLSRLPHPGHRTDTRLKHSPRLSVKEAYLLVPEFDHRSRLQDWHTSKGYRRALREYRLGNSSRCSHLPCYSTLVYPRKEIIHSSGALCFETANWETPLYCQTMVASEAYAQGPTGLYILHSLKAAS